MATVVVVEPWYGGSHRVWVDGWKHRSRHHIELLTLPDRFWRWRMRAGAVELAELFSHWVGKYGRPDLVVVSSLLDAAAFGGLARRSLGHTPLAVYMHENQLLYPPTPGRRRDDGAALVNWKSLLAADAVWWNSGFHRDALLGAVPDLLARQPEPIVGGVDAVAARSTVLWPGVEVAELIAADKPANAVPVVLWNQRWDHDKNPQTVFAALAGLADDGEVAFDLVLAGEDQGRSGESGWVRDRLGDRIVHQGWLEPADYRRYLVQADVVVSAADHEFFGIAIVEAIAAGAVPVLPNRLSFVELVEPRWHRAALYERGELVPALRRVLADVGAARREVEGLRASMSRFDIAKAAAAHDVAVDRLIGA